MKDINLFKACDSIYLKRIKSKAEVLSSDTCEGYLIESSEKETRRIIDSLKGSGKQIGFVGRDDSFNRRAIETLRIDYLISPEKNVSRDTLKQRDSGINHVVAKVAKEKGVSFVVDFSEVANLKGKERALRIGKIIQNIEICRKVGCGLKIASLTTEKGSVVDEKGRVAFGISLGMSSEQSRDCVRF